MSSKLGFCCLGPVYMTWLYIWCIEKRSLEHSPTQQEKFWVVEEDSTVLTLHGSTECVDTYKVATVFFSMLPAVFRANVFCTDLRQDNVTPVTFTSQCMRLKSSALQIHLTELKAPPLQVFQLLSSMPASVHLLAHLQHRDKALARPPAHKDSPTRPVRRCSMASHQGGTVIRWQIIIHAVSVWMLFSPFHRRSIPWDQANEWGRLQEVLRFPDHAGWREKRYPRGKSWWDSAAGSSQRAALLEAAQASPSHNQGQLSCSPWSSWKTATQTPGLPSGPGWLFCDCHSLTAGTRHLSPPKLLSCVLIYKHVKTSKHQEHQWQRQGEADAGLFAKQNNLCWCRYNKNHSGTSYVKPFTSQNPIRSRKTRAWYQQRVHCSDVVLHRLKLQSWSTIRVGRHKAKFCLLLLWKTGQGSPLLRPLWLFLLFYPLSTAYGCTEAILLMKGAMQLLSAATVSTLSAAQRTIVVGAPYREHVGMGTGACIRQISCDKASSASLQSVHATGDQAWIQLGNATWPGPPGT